MKIREIARLLGAEVIGDPEAEVHRVSALATARDGDVAFMARPDGAPAGFPTCLIAGLDHPEDDRIRSLIRTADPKLTFALVAEILHPPRKRSAEMHPTAVISDSASIGKNVFIGAFVCIGDGSEVGDDAQLRAGARVGDNVRIGQRTVLDPNVFVEDGCTIGNDVILHSGVIIGTDGFGFVRSKDRYVKFPQIGTVVIDDHVEIGANTCIDRGALGETRIGEGTKIDNLVQIGHNVVVGKRVVIAAQTGISGSTVIEDDCVIGGQVGFGDHARVLSGAVIGSQAGILPGKIVRPGVWWGTPIQPLEEYKRQNAHLKGIGRLKNEVREIKRRIADDDK